MYSYICIRLYIYTYVPSWHTPGGRDGHAMGAEGVVQMMADCTARLQVCLQGVCLEAAHHVCSFVLAVSLSIGNAKMSFSIIRLRLTFISVTLESLGQIIGRR
jgi:hypothetical protein